MKRRKLKTTKYPFMEKADEYLKTREGCISDITYRNLERRFSRQERDLIRLKEEGKISTMSPKSMTIDDIKTFILYRKGKGVSPSDISHDISALDQLLTYSGNTAVKNCLTINKGLKPVNKHVRLEPLPEDTYDTILGAYSRIDHSDFQLVRAYTMVLLYIGTGARNKELRLANISDVDKSNWTIFFEHVKGEQTYGVTRKVPIPSELQPILEQYLFDRAVWLSAHHATSNALFFTLGGEHGHMCSNSVRKIKTIVERQIGRKFELRDCRRAYGQFYLT